MKTASLGLLEVPGYVWMPGGMPPQTPPLLVRSRAHPPFFVFFKKRFLANERDNIFGHGRENTSFSWHRVLDHLGLIPLFTFNYTANYDGVNGWYYQIGVIKYIFLDYERYSNSLSSGC